MRLDYGLVKTNPFELSVAGDISEYIPFTDTLLNNLLTPDPFKVRFW